MRRVAFKKLNRKIVVEGYTCANCGHAQKWESCICEKCGTILDAWHDFIDVGNCRAKCSVCNKVKFNHDYIITYAYHGGAGSYAKYRCKNCRHEAIIDNDWGTDGRETGFTVID